jgi:hypothetical protein
LHDPHQTRHRVIVDHLDKNMNVAPLAD